jgi:hypothetical protein
MNLIGLDGRTRRTDGRTDNADVDHGLPECNHVEDVCFSVFYDRN